MPKLPEKRRITYEELVPSPEDYLTQYQFDNYARALGAGLNSYTWEWLRSLCCGRYLSFKFLRDAIFNEGRNTFFLFLIESNAVLINAIAFLISICEAEILEKDGSALGLEVSGYFSFGLLSILIFLYFGLFSISSCELLCNSGDNGGNDYPSFWSRMQNSIAAKMALFDSASRNLLLATPFLHIMAETGEALGLGMISMELFFKRTPLHLKLLPPVGIALIAGWTEFRKFFPRSTLLKYSGGENFGVRYFDCFGCWFIDDWDDLLSEQCLCFDFSGFPYVCCTIEFQGRATVVKWAKIILIAAKRGVLVGASIAELVKAMLALSGAQKALGVVRLSFFISAPIGFVLQVILFIKDFSQRKLLYWEQSYDRILGIASTVKVIAAAFISGKLSRGLFSFLSIFFGLSSLLSRGPLSTEGAKHIFHIFYRNKKGPFSMMLCANGYYGLDVIWSGEGGYKDSRWKAWRDAEFHMQDCYQTPPEKLSEDTKQGLLQSVPEHTPAYKKLYDKLYPNASEQELELEPSKASSSSSQLQPPGFKSPLSASTNSTKIDPLDKDTVVNYGAINSAST